MNGLLFILALFLFLLVILSVPITFKVSGSFGPGKKLLDVNLGWGWKLLTTTFGIIEREKTIKFCFAGIAFSAPNKKPKKVKAKCFKKVKNKTRKKEEKNKSNLVAYKMLLNKEMLIEIIGYLKKILRSIRLRLQFNGIYGTDDPALTGLLVGLIAALQAERININLNVDFNDSILDIAGEMSGRIIPIAVVWYTIRVILARSVRRVWLHQLKTKFIRKKSKEVTQYV